MLIEVLEVLLQCFLLVLFSFLALLIPLIVIKAIRYVVTIIGDIIDSL